MNKIILAFGMALVAVMVIAIGGYYYPESVGTVVDSTLGAFGTRFPSGLAVGTSASVSTVGSFSVGSTTAKQVLNIGGGTCNLTGDPLTFSASTTKMHFCSATGVRVGDQVFVTLPSSITGANSSVLAGLSNFGGLHVAGAAATTSNIIGVALTNFTGVATGSYTQATTGVMYLFIR